MSKKQEPTKLMKYFPLNGGAEEREFKLLGAIDAEGHTWIARATLQQCMDGIDFSKRFMASDKDAHLELVIRKGESGGLLKDGRICVLITSELAKKIVADKRYFTKMENGVKVNDADLRSAVNDTIEAFELNYDIGKPKTESQKIAEVKIAEFVKAPESPSECSAAVMKAVNEATGPVWIEGTQGGITEFTTIKPVCNARYVGGVTMKFMGETVSVAVLETSVKESTVRNAYVQFKTICKAMGLDSDKSMMSISNILNTGLAVNWGMDLVNITVVKPGSTCEGTGGWINLNSVYSWLATYELYMKRLDPAFNCDAQKTTIAIWQTALKEAALKFISGPMHAVVPKADDNKAGKKPGLNPDPEPEAGIDMDIDPKEIKPGNPVFNKDDFLKSIKEQKTKVRSVVLEVLDPKAVTMEQVAAVATESYKKIVEAEAAPATQSQDPNWTWDHDKVDGDDFLFDSQTVSGPFEVSRDQFMDLKFMDDHIGIIDLNGGRYVSIRGICKNLGLNIAGQFEKLKNNPKFTCMDIHTRDSLGRSAELLCLKAKQVPTWLAEINVAKISSALRPKLLAYQEDLMEAVYQYHTAGVAINKDIVPPAISIEIQALLEAVRQTNETARQMMQANQRLAIDSQENLEYAADKVENIVNLASTEVIKAREEAEAKKKLAEQKEAEAIFSRQEEIRALKAKDTAEGTLARVMSDYEPAIEKGKAFDELVYNGPSKNITTIARECGLVSGTELNRLLVDQGMILKHRRYPNTWEPSAKMMRMVPIGTKLGCIELVGKGNDQTVPQFGHTTTVQCWAWMPAGELLIKRIVREHIDEVTAAEEVLELGKADLKKPSTSVNCTPNNLVSGPPSTPFPGNQGTFEFVAGGKMP